MISQPVYTDGSGTVRFKENDIVLYLLQKSGVTLEQIELLPFSNEGKIQFAQLIGYEILSFGELSFVTSDLFNACMIMNSENLSPDDGRIKSLEIELAALKVMLRGPMSRLYNIDPDVLK